jgi:ribosomal protein S18 acetylase RimI-like enzyme
MPVRKLIQNARVSMISDVGGSGQLWANCGVFLERQRVLNRLVELSVMLGEQHEAALDPAKVRLGVENMLRNPLLEQYVVAWSNDDRILGMMELKKRFESWYNHSDWHIDNFIVFHEFRNHGIGSKLLDYIKRAAMLEGIEVLWLEVAYANEQVLGFYRKRGFTEKGHLMEYRIPPDGPNAHVGESAVGPT